MNIGEVGAEVRATETTVDEAHAVTALAVERCAQARAILGQALAATQNHQAASAVEALAAAILHGEAAEVAMAEATTRLDEWLTAAGVPKRQPPPTGTPVERAAAPIPDSVRRLAEGLQPWRPRTPVRARILDTGEELASGRDLSAGVGLLPEYARRVAVVDHAEGHLAATMRRPGARQHETLIVNKRPCPGDLGCDRTLPHIIPRGSSITVYVVTLDGLRWWRTYRGTGEGIAP